MHAPAPTSEPLCVTVSHGRSLAADTHLVHLDQESGCPFGSGLLPASPYTHARLRFDHPVSLAAKRANSNHVVLLHVLGRRRRISLPSSEPNAGPCKHPLYATV